MLQIDKCTSVPLSKIKEKDGEKKAKVAKMLRSLWFFLFTGLLGAQALRFELYAKDPGQTKPKCIGNFINADTLVVVDATVSGKRGDGQRVDIEIIDSNGNQYAKPRDVAGHIAQAITTLDSGTLQVCFTNTRQGGGQAGMSRTVDLNVETGAGALNWAQIQQDEKLKPIEVELRRLEKLSGELQADLDYLKRREARLRDTNESTNDRVKRFAIFTTLVLFGLGIWQIIYLRAYFKRKHLID